MVPNNETKFDDRFRKWVSTEESTFEMVSHRRRFVRQPRGSAERRFMPQYLAKGCKGQTRKIMLWGYMVVRHACASWGHWDTQC